MCFQSSRCYVHKYGEILHVKTPDSSVIKKKLEIQEEVLIKNLGKEEKKFKQAVWESESDKILFIGLTAKFSQNEKLLVFLKATGETLLAEGNPHDRLFGVELSFRDKDLWKQEGWKSKNKLGIALMKVREMFK